MSTGCYFIRDYLVMKYLLFIPEIFWWLLSATSSIFHPSMQQPKFYIFSISSSKFHLYLIVLSTQAPKWGKQCWCKTGIFGDFTQKNILLIYQFKAKIPGDSLKVVVHLHHHFFCHPRGFALNQYIYTRYFGVKSPKIPVLHQQYLPHFGATVRRIASTINANSSHLSSADMLLKKMNK